MRPREHEQSEMSRPIDAYESIRRGAMFVCLLFAIGFLYEGVNASSLASRVLWLAYGIVTLFVIARELLWPRTLGANLKALAVAVLPAVCMKAVHLGPTMESLLLFVLLGAMFAWGWYLRRDAHRADVIAHHQKNPPF